MGLRQKQFGSQPSALAAQPGTQMAGDATLAQADMLPEEADLSALDAAFVQQEAAPESVIPDEAFGPTDELDMLFSDLDTGPEMIAGMPVGEDAGVDFSTRAGLSFGSTQKERREFLEERGYEVEFSKKDKDSILVRKQGSKEAFAKVDPDTIEFSFELIKDMFADTTRGITEGAISGTTQAVGIGVGTALGGPVGGIAGRVGGAAIGGALSNAAANKIAEDYLGISRDPTRGLETADRLKEAAFSGAQDVIFGEVLGAAAKLGNTIFLKPIHRAVKLGAGEVIPGAVSRTGKDYAGSVIERENLEAGMTAIQQDVDFFAHNLLGSDNPRIGRTMMDMGENELARKKLLVQTQQFDDALANLQETVGPSVDRELVGSRIKSGIEQASDDLGKALNVAKKDFAELAGNAHIAPNAASKAARDGLLDFFQLPADMIEANGKLKKPSEVMTFLINKSDLSNNQAKDVIQTYNDLWLASQRGRAEALANPFTIKDTDLMLMRTGNRAYPKTTIEKSGPVEGYFSRVRDNLNKDRKAFAQSIAESRGDDPRAKALLSALDNYSKKTDTIQRLERHLDIKQGGSPRAFARHFNANEKNASLLADVEVALGKNNPHFIELKRQVFDDMINKHIRGASKDGARRGVGLKTKYNLDKLETKIKEQYGTAMFERHFKDQARELKDLTQLASVLDKTKPKLSVDGLVENAGSMKMIQNLAIKLTSPFRNARLSALYMIMPKGSRVGDMFESGAWKQAVLKIKDATQRQEALDMTTQMEKLFQVLPPAVDGLPSAQEFNKLWKRFAAESVARGTTAGIANDKNTERVNQVIAPGNDSIQGILERINEEDD